jgi:hypothetical protein
MSFGSGRLVATRAATNIPFRFDGFEAIYTRPLWEATAFLTRPVEDNGGISGSDPGTAFWGLYLTHWFDAPHDRPGPVLLRDSPRTWRLCLRNGRRTPAFAGRPRIRRMGRLGLERGASPASGHLRKRVHPRVDRRTGFGLHLGCHVEPQAGSQSGHRQRRPQPKQRALETFDALYFKSGYFNDASLIRPQNVIGVHPNFTVKPSRTVSVDGGANGFGVIRKMTRSMQCQGSSRVPALKNAASYVGTALDVNLTWQIQRHLSFQASYVHFFTGSYIHEAGGHDVDYVSATIDFLFSVNESNL